MCVLKIKAGSIIEGTFTFTTRLKIEITAGIQKAYDLQSQYRHFRQS